MTDQDNNRNNTDSNNKNDALEAFGVFANARNFFFWLLLIAMLVLQTAFWVVDRGLIDPVLPEGEKPKKISNTINQPELIILTAGQTQTNPAQSPVEAKPSEPKPQKLLPVNKNPLETAEIINPTLKISLKIVNFILPFVAVTYCLVLLIGMKLALVGRLGGLANSGKALFLSLLAMVLIVPWQQMVAPDLAGVLFGYDQLIERYRQIGQVNDSLEYVIYYGRFTGLWALSMIILLAAQGRSCRATRDIRKRLCDQQKPPSAAKNSDVR